MVSFVVATGAIAVPVPVAAVVPVDVAGVAAGCVSPVAVLDAVAVTGAVSTSETTTDAWGATIGASASFCPQEASRMADAAKAQILVA